jgi:hypothetical protein
MPLARALTDLHRRATGSSWLQLFTAATRGLLALGFIPSGLKKVLGHPFAPGIPTVDPVGAFFDAFFQARGYYVFVGAVQLLAALLLLFPQTAALGAVLYLPIILNIFVITAALAFKGTALVTGLMLLASIYLLCWDYDRWKGLLPGGTASIPNAELRSRHLGVGGTVLAGAMAAVTTFTGLLVLRAVVERGSVLLPIVSLLLASALTLVGALRYTRRERRRDLIHTASGAA